MKEDSETPFTFNPSVNPEDEKQLGGESFFSKNKKLILILAGCLIVIIIIAIVLIVVLKGKGKGNKNKDSNKGETSDNYFVAKFEIPEDSTNAKIFSQFSSEPNRLNYSIHIISVKVNNSFINAKEGQYLFKKKGNYTLYFYLTKTIPFLDNFFFDCKYLVEVSFEHIDMRPIKSVIELFEGCINLKKINYGDNFKTESLIAMDELFSSCISLTEIDLSNFNTSKVVSMNDMFVKCSQLTSINFGKIKTPNLKSMRGMFKECSALTSIDLSNFDTSNVENYEHIFNGCKSLASIDTKYIFTDNAKDLTSMFQDCSSLVYLNLDHFNTSSVTDMSYMFTGCGKLQSISLKKWNTENVNDMNAMFRGCTELRSIDLSSFYTPKLKNIKELFSGCAFLLELDLSKFDTSIVQDVTNAFYGFGTNGKITYNSTRITSNVINLFPSSWEKIDVEKKEEKEEEKEEEGKKEEQIKIEPKSKAQHLEVALLKGQKIEKKDTMKKQKDEQSKPTKWDKYNLKYIKKINIVFANRPKLPKINLISYIIEPFLLKNYIDEEGNELKELTHYYYEDFCFNLGIAFKLILSIFAFFVFIFSKIYKIDGLSFLLFLILYFVMTILSITFNFPSCYRNRKTFGFCTLLDPYKKLNKKKYKPRNPNIISVVRFISDLVLALVSLGLIVVFLFFPDDDNNEDFLDIYPIEPDKKTENLLLPNICYSSIYNLPLYLYLPFINDAYYYREEINETGPHFYSSLQRTNYRRLFFGDDYEIVDIRNLINKTDSGTVKMIQYNVVNKAKNIEITILSIKGTTFNKDIYLDAQLYFSSVLLNLLSTFSIMTQKNTKAFKLIEYSLSIPYRIFFRFLIIDDYLQKLQSAYINNEYTFYKNVVIVGHSLGGGLAKLFGRIMKKQAISLSGPGINAFHSLWKYEGKSENFEISSIDLVPDRDLVPRVEVSGGTIYRIVCQFGAFECHSKVNSLCEVLIMCDIPTYKEYCMKVAELNSEQMKSIAESVDLN